MSETASLLSKVRNYLDVTWVDAELDQKLTDIIGRGTAYLDRLAGFALDYTARSDAMQLLLDYCRYVRSDAFELFQRNFIHELNALQLDGGAPVEEPTEPVV